MAGRKGTRRVVVVVGTILAIAVAATVTAVAALGGAHAQTGLFAYVANSNDGTVTPVNLATGHPGTPIKLGGNPAAIAISPDGTTAYVANGCGCGKVTPVNLATGHPGAPIKVGTGLLAIAITRDGRTAYVVEPFQDAVISVNLATGRPGAPIILDTTHPGLLPAEALNPDLIAITPDGKTAYVVDANRGAIFPINLATGRLGTPITFGYSTPVAIAITPDARTAYVAAIGVPLSTVAPDSPGTVIPVNLATGHPGTPIETGADPVAIAISPDGRTAYVVDDGDSGTTTPVDLATGQPGTPIETGTDPQAIAITPDGTTAYVTDDGNGHGDGTVIPVNLATGHPGTPIKVGADPTAIVITR